jgi:23S rRNA pseudouridine1911/1915/1917 synthase
VTRTLTVDAEAGAAGPRLDAFLGQALAGLPRRLVRRVIAEGDVRVNGRRAAKGLRLQPGDRVTVPDLPVALTPEPALALPILHEDASLAVIDKPGGMPAHALDPRQRGTAAAFVLARWPETATVGDALAPGLIHRLDGGTSGVLVVARTAEAFGTLRQALAARAIEKRYLAVVAGTAEDARIDTPLAHDTRDRRRMTAAGPGARSWPAETEVRVVTAGRDRSLVAVTMRTGVTHQIRVHLAQAGHPVLGDLLYGGPPADDLEEGRHALHASGITLPHPRDGTTVTVESPLPADLEALEIG